MSPSAFHPARSSAWRRGLATLVLVLVLVLELASAIDLRHAPYSGLGLYQDDREVGRVADGSPAAEAGFRKGDFILEAPPLLPSPHPGETAHYRVRRGAGELDLTLTYGRLPGSEAVRKLSLGLVALSFFVVGWLVCVRRGDLTALVFALFCLDIGYVIGNLMHRPDWLLARWPAADKTLYDAAILALPAFFLHFFLLFPEPDLRITRRRALILLLYLPAAAGIVIAAHLNRDLLAAPAGAAPGPGVTIFQTTSSVSFLGALLLGAALFLRSFRRTRSPAVRRRLKGVVLGTVAGVTPIVLVDLLITIWPNLEFPGDRLAALALALIPLSFGHAIVRYGLLDVEIAIKRGVAYTILTATLAGLYLAVVSGLGRLLASVAPAGFGGILTFVAILLMAMIFSPLRVRIERWVDRTFYREKHEYRETLRSLARGLARLMDLDSILDLVTGSVRGTLHPEFLALYIRAAPDAPGFTRARAEGDVSSLPDAGSPEETELTGWIAARGETVILERRLAASLPADMPLRLRRTLHRGAAAVLVPFISEGSLVAWLVMGSKKSEERVSGEDATLLDTLADQAATAIQNAWLHRDALLRLELERELATARAVQLELLPPAPPRIPGFELEVVCHPSREIGGDLYDFVNLGPDRWGIVLGDATGHGIGAALLMAALQATVQAETETGRRPRDVVAAANRRLCLRGGDRRFASLVYGELDARRARFFYVNAGHPSPFLLDGAAGTSVLDRGGLLLGVEPGAAYEEASVELEPGSVLLFYTDGVVEHGGESGEEFGAPRLLDVFRACATRPLGEIAAEIQRAVNAHGSAPPGDDITLLLLRRLPA